MHFHQPVRLVLSSCIAVSLALANTAWVDAKSQVRFQNNSRELSRIAQEDPQHFMQALDEILIRQPHLAASAKSATLLAASAAAAVAKMTGTNTHLYGEISRRIIAAAPAKMRTQVAKSVRTAVARYERVDAEIHTSSVGVFNASQPASPIIQEQQSILLTSPQSSKGIKVGSFIFYPEVQMTQYYDSNIYSTQSDKKSDLINVISTNFLLQSDWERHSLSIEAHMDNAHYSKYKKESYTDFRVNAEGRYDFSENTSVYGGLLYARSHEDRSSPEDGFGIKPTIYDEQTAYGGINHYVDGWGFHLGGTFKRYIFEDTETSTGFISNADRNRDHVILDAAISKELNEVFTPQVKFTVDKRNYARAFDDDGYARDSLGYRVTVGTQVRINDNLSGEVNIGYMTRNYKDYAYSSISGVAFDGNLRWRVQDPTTITLYTGRSIEETTLYGSPGYLYTYVGAGIEHQLTKEVTLMAHGTYSVSKFQDIGRRDKDYELGAGIKYQLTENIYVGADYRYLTRKSNVQFYDYNKHQVFLRFGAVF